MGKTPRTEEADSASMNHVFVTVATRLKEARLRLKLTQKQVADLSGLQQSYIYEIETGRTNITLRTFIRLAEVLQTDIRALLPETGPGLASPEDVSIFRAILDKTVAVLADHETQDEERHRQDGERHRQDGERHRQDAERYRQDAERMQRQSALLRELTLLWLCKNMLKMRLRLGGSYRQPGHQGLRPTVVAFRGAVAHQSHIKID
jgi:transcriptional regulator with XRE-family HTH domain